MLPRIRIDGLCWNVTKWWVIVNRFRGSHGSSRPVKWKRPKNSEHFTKSKNQNDSENVSLKIGHNLWWSSVVEENGLGLEFLVQVEQIHLVLEVLRSSLSSLSLRSTTSCLPIKTMGIFPQTSWPITCLQYQPTHNSVHTSSFSTWNKA